MAWHCSWYCRSSGSSNPPRRWARLIAQTFLELLKRDNYRGQLSVLGTNDALFLCTCLYTFLCACLYTCLYTIGLEIMKRHVFAHGVHKSARHHVYMQVYTQIYTHTFTPICVHFRTPVSMCRSWVHAISLDFVGYDPLGSLWLNRRIGCSFSPQRHQIDEHLISTQSPGQSPVAYGAQRAYGSYTCTLVPPDAKVSVALAT